MPTNKNNLADSAQKHFLIWSVTVLVILLFYFMSPFLTTMLFAGIIVTAVYPIDKLLHKKLKLPRSISAFVTLILILALIVVPFTFFFFFLAGEATNAYQVISRHVNELTAGDIRLVPSLISNSFLGKWIDKISIYAPVSTSDVFSAIRDTVGTISTVLISQTTNILKSISLGLLQVLIFVLTMFYFIKDGDRFVTYANSLLPLSQAHRKEVFHKLKKLSYAIIYGIFGAAILQGFLVGIGFYFAGISNAAFWGTIAAFFSPVPYIGVSVIWIPAVIMLFVTNKVLIGVFLLAWCIGIVSFADNIIKPYIIGASSRIHPLAVLLVLIGGLLVIGLKGLFWGPTLLTLTLTFLHIYELEYAGSLGKKR